LASSTSAPTGAEPYDTASAIGPKRARGASNRRRLSKAQLTLGAATVSVTQFDTHGLDTFGFALNGFSLWASQTPGCGGDPAAGGTDSS
jgi:hypothetical protein